MFTMKIGLTYTYNEEKHNNYIRWLRGNDDKIEIIKLSAEGNNIQELESCNALLMSGGIDVHPRYYKSWKLTYTRAPGEFNEARDEFEVNAFHRSQHLKIPVLGICRGFQLINCLFGGTLKQDIGKEANGIHRAEQHDKAHGMNLLKNTLLSELAGTDRFAVNSAHHQCIKKLGHQLKANAISDDGIIEGMEREDPSNKPFLLAVQWHPERMFKLQLADSFLSAGIRELFINEIRKSNASRQ